MAKKTSTSKKVNLLEMTEADLQAQLEALRKDMWHSRIKAREGALQQNHLMGAARKQIARIHTVLNQKRRALAAAGGRPGA